MVERRCVYFPIIDRFKFRLLVHRLGIGGDNPLPSDERAFAIVVFIDRQRRRYAPRLRALDQLISPDLHPRALLLTDRRQ